LKVNEKQIDCIINQQKGIDTEFRLNPAETKKITIYYKTRGTGKWIYKPESSGFGRIKNFTMKVRTDFEAIDFPEDSLSPHKKQVSANGCQLLWKADNLITSRPVAIVMPEKLNPGPLVSKVTFFAPVCLLFFFIVMMSITVIAKINIHPMHYLFISAGFFAFNLLFAYLVDVINVHLAFIISTVVTLILVNSYLRTALGAKYPWKWGAAAQFCYLILFSYSFFFKGLTGLTVTIGSIITLAVLMYLTVRIDWTDIFKSSRQRKSEKSNYYSEEKSLNA
jgi:inner membrane protein involved in colicin E2 resistance